MNKYTNHIIFFLILILVASCTIKAPQSPEWETEINVPLMNDSYFMRDLADSTEDYIISMQSDTVYFSASNDIETSNVGDELKVDGQTEIFEE
ncbi:MAG: hypothetical protein U9P79_06980, partial [Candidatus Cloacimonadota bacterium]|nr:hypothetical protein [Candidatus Cloacimonadota bacterium]